MLLLDIKNSICSTNRIKKSYLYVWLLSMILIIVIVVLSMVHCAMKSRGYKDLQYSIDNNLIKKIIYAIVCDENIYFEPKEFNAVLNNLILKNLEVPENIKNVSIVPQNDTENLIFIPITYNKINLEISLKSNITFNRNSKLLECQVLSANIGNLRVPRKFLFDNINKEFIKYEHETFFIKPEMKLELFNKNITCSLDDFRFKDGKILLKIHSDVLNNIKLKSLDNLFNNLKKHQIT